jgi:hypothetical protein
MLSFNTTHALTGYLLDADAHAESRGWGNAPVLLLVQDRPLVAAGTRQLRHMRAVTITLQPDKVAERRAGIPGVLHDIVATLADRDSQLAAEHDAVDLDAAAGQICGCGARVLAWAVLYEDVHVDAADLRQIRRVDAVDIDGRVYQLTRLRGETHPVVVIDEQPDPAGTPATHPGLAALLAATAKLARHTHYGAH